MAKLLYIEASPRKERSSSIAVAKEFLAAYKEKNPSDQIEVLDLWSASLPEFDNDTASAKYAVMHGQSHSAEEQKVWRKVEKVIEHFKSADKYLFSLPMWNFSIPYKLKHFVDVIVQPGYTFSFSPQEGYKGLVLGKPAAVIYAQGGVYRPGSGAESYDLQTRYLEQILGFIGFTDIQRVVVDGTLADPETKSAHLAEAKGRARDLGASL
jgi:FMN-dependent NADH-azoreductase